MLNIETVSSELIKRETSKDKRYEYLKKMSDELREQFDKVDIMKSIKKANSTTYLDTENLTHEQIEEESKKDILEANKKNLSEFNKKLKQGSNRNPKENK